MYKKIEELKKRMPLENHHMAKLTEHMFEALDRYAEEHRRLVAIDAIAGIKPNGQEEIAFYEHLKEFKDVLIKELEKTVEEIEHKGDKHWKKHYKDGI